MDWQEWRTLFNLINLNYCHKINNFHFFYPSKLTFLKLLPTTGPRPAIPDPINPNASSGSTSKAPLIAAYLFPSLNIEHISYCVIHRHQSPQPFPAIARHLPEMKRASRGPTREALSPHTACPVSRGQRNVTTSTTEAEIVYRPSRRLCRESCTSPPISSTSMVVLGSGTTCVWRR